MSEDRDISAHMKEIIDAQIESAMETSTMMVVPINSTSTRAGTSFSNAGHWTIMKCVILTNKWTYCNPDTPKDGSSDQHLRRAVKLVRSLCISKTFILLLNISVRIS